MQSTPIRTLLGALICALTVSDRSRAADTTHEDAADTLVRQGQEGRVKLADSKYPILQLEAKAKRLSCCPAEP